MIFSFPWKATHLNKNLKIFLSEMIKKLIILLRIHQYTKNLFIFMPIFFGKELGNPKLFFCTFMAFIAFSCAASATYIINDCCDLQEDRIHPEKRYRPLPYGLISPRAAMILSSLLLGSGCLLMGIISLDALLLLLVYLLLSVAYSLKIKHIAILDISVISVGFVIRLFVGSVVSGIALSHWIIVLTFLLALFLALAKRRDDVLILQRTGQKTRKVIDGYNLKFLDSAMVMASSIIVLAYILWALSPEVAARLGNENLYLSSLFVVLGVFRYMQISFVENNSGNPSMVFLRDRFIQVVLFLWVGTLSWILYLN